MIKSVIQKCRDSSRNIGAASVCCYLPRGLTDLEEGLVLATKGSRWRLGWKLQTLGMHLDELGGLPATCRTHVQSPLLDLRALLAEDSANIPRVGLELWQVKL